jgi:LuxR family maltose regulon positive regulatory protein
MPANSVIRTRLYPPVSRAALIERGRLLELLEQDSGRHLTIVAAPAGFGKTTILGQWFERLRRQGLRCCWCSLDREDNQPTRFLRHVVSALRTVGDIGSDLIRQLDTTLIADIAATLPTLLNELADFGHGTVLFIDDYHHVRSDEINHYVELLVTLAPPNLRIVIASRLRPHLSLSSLRMRGQLCEITANHLRFDIAETRASCSARSGSTCPGRSSTGSMSTARAGPPACSSHPCRCAMRRGATRSSPRSRAACATSPTT